MIKKHMWKLIEVQIPIWQIMQFFVFHFYQVNWRKNRDGIVTGFISGSPAFEEGERITTSPIANGDISAGEVVQTGSGSRYFLV